MENAVKAIIISATVIITLVIVSFAFLLLRQGEQFVQQSQNEIADMTAEMAESKYTQYHGAIKSGSEVSNVVKTYMDDLDITIATKKSTTEYSSSSTAAELSKMIQESSDKYVNPSGEFLGEVTRDANGTITDITFTQQ